MHPLCHQIKRAYAILPFLLPAYESPSSVGACDSLVRTIDQILPPLSEWDEVKLCVSLPLLAAALGGSGEEWKAEDRSSDVSVNSSITVAAAMGMVPYLAQFCLGSDHDARARSAAASCLYLILLYGDKKNESIPKLIESTVSPALVDVCGRLRKELVEESVAGDVPPLSLSHYEDVINIF